MARCTPEQALQTRESLLDAALEVFAEEGVARPSLTKVAERAGMTRGAIYGHFRNKADLFNALCDRYLFPAEVLEQMREEGAEDPLGTLRAWVARITHANTTDPQRQKLLSVLFLRVEATEGSDILDRLRDNADKVHFHEKELMRLAVARGQLPADLDVEGASLALTAWLGGLLRMIALCPERDWASIAPGMGEAVLEGLLRGPEP
ncbi:MAG: TetR family transcriptional regulator [Myxococcota bacterium]|nr:TetR family transcriptional regulator [Myxococcota bacterium]